MPQNQVPGDPMPGNPMSENEKSNLRRVLQGAEAVDSIRHAQEFLASAGGFDATLETLDAAVEEIRAETGYHDEDPSGEGE